MVSPKGTLRQQQTISITPGALFSLSSYPPPWGGKLLPSEPPLASKIGGTEGLVTDTRMHWWSRAQEDRSKQIPSFHPNTKNQRALQNHFETPKNFHQLWNLRERALFDGKHGKAIPSTHENHRSAKRKILPCLHFPAIPQHAALLLLGPTLPWPCQHTPEVPSSWGYWGVEDFILHVS